MKDEYFYNLYQKDGTYETYYSLFKSTAKYYDKVTKKEMYFKIVNYFKEDHERILYFLTTSLVNYLKNYDNKKDKELSSNDDFIRCKLFIEDYIYQEKKEILNPEYNWLISYVKNNYYKALEISEFVDFNKGLLDLYGILTKEDMFKMYKDAFPESKLSFKEYDKQITKSYIILFANYGKKYIYYKCIDKQFNLRRYLQSIKDACEHYNIVDYKRYSKEQVLSFANKFMLFPIEIDEDSFQFYLISDHSHYFSSLMDLPEPDRFFQEEDEDENEDKLNEYLHINYNTPKWLLKGNTIIDIKVSQHNDELEINEDINDETIFKDKNEYFKFKKLICDYYDYCAKKIIHKKLNLYDFDNVTGSEEEIVEVFDKVAEKSDYYVSSFIKSGARILNYDDYIVLNSLRESRRSSYIILDINEDGLILLDFENDVRLLVKALAVPFVELFKTKNILIDVTLIPYNGVITYDSFLQQNLIEMSQINLSKDKIETYDELQLLQTDEEFLEFYKNIKN